METVGKNADCGPVLPADSYSRVVEYVFLTDPSIHLRFLRNYIGVNLDQENNDKNLTFTRRYLDPNRVTYEVGFLSFLKVGKILNV